MRGRAVVLPPPPETISPGKLRFFSADRPEVHAGQLVREGQTIFEARRDDRAGHVSPVAGRVTMVAPIEAGDQTSSFGADRGATCPGYEIDIEPSTPAVETSLRINPPRMRTLDQWLPVARQYGLGTGRDGNVGLVAQLDAAQRRKPDAVVCVGADEFPPFPDRASMMASFADDAALGTLILGEVAGARQSIMLAPPDSLVTKRLKPTCRNFGMRLLTAPDIYPIADPTVLAWALPASPRRRRVEFGRNPAEEGVVMIDPWTAIQIGRWFTLRKLEMVRPVFIACPGEREPFTAAYVMRGQSREGIPAIVEASRDRAKTVVIGNPMSGRRALDGATLEPGDGLVTIMTAEPPREEEPCIACGWCVQVCPTGLKPIDLVTLARANRRDAHVVDRLRWCVDCGLCSHVCPSAIPLAEELRAGRAPASAATKPIAIEGAAHAG